MAHMGPPPSPKEPRRSGRRSVPSASSSKSPAPSPISEATPRPKLDAHRTPSTSSSRSKRSKQEDVEDNLDEQLKTPSAPANSRNKRKSKTKDKRSTPLGAAPDHHPQKNPTEATASARQDEEEQGITRCVCGSSEDDPDAGEFMAQCETCKVWQHGLCMGYTTEALLGDDDYYCEQCRPDMHRELLKKLAERMRPTSANSHHSSVRAPSNSRSSRSHSPLLSAKPQKRRNTMNSRDAAYEESVKTLIEITAAEAASAGTGPSHVLANDRDLKAEDDGDTGLGNRRKRKRTDDDSISVKRTRSGSATSERPIMSNSNRDDPASVGGSKTNATPTTTSRSRQKRVVRRSAQIAESVASAEVDEAAPPKRPSRTKNANDSRRSHAGGLKVDAAAASHPRAHHNSHAYAVSQQPLYTSWNLPDYLAHLEPMLPSDVPRPLEIRASGKDLSEISIERGVKVKWPSKRTSIGDMNKRVRSLVEWVGREQAGATERGRRKNALVKALEEWKRKQDSLSDNAVAADDDGTALDIDPKIESPVQEKPNPPTAFQLQEYDWLQSPTMRMMEEVMEELISFQERFGPGSKTKERERRIVST